MAFHAAHSVGNAESRANTAISKELSSPGSDSDVVQSRSVAAGTVVNVEYTRNEFPPPTRQRPSPITHRRRASLRSTVRSSDVNVEDCSGVESRGVMISSFQWVRSGESRKRSEILAIGDPQGVATFAGLVLVKTAFFRNAERSDSA